MIIPFRSIRTGRIDLRLTALVPSGSMKGIKPSKCVLMLLGNASSAITTIIDLPERIVSLTFPQRLSGIYECLFPVVSLLFMFISLNFTIMIHFLRLLPALLVGIVLGFVIACWGAEKIYAQKDAEIAALNADLKGQKAARREQVRKYDELYDQFFRLTQTNSEMAREVQLYKNTYEEAADEVYSLFLQGTSRQELCKLYPNVAYSTLCGWIRRKRKEALEPVDPATSKQGSLI